MKIRGWHINLSGSEVPIYGSDKNWVQKGSQIGKITKNECFAEGTVEGAAWEGWGNPIHFKNASGNMTLGAISADNFAFFGDYASNGTSWVAVSTLKRKVQYATVAYYADGSKCCDLPAGSYVWLDEDCTRGKKNPNYIAVSSVQPVGENKINFSGNGFVNLTHGGRWLNVSSILLRKA